MTLQQETDMNLSTLKPIIVTACFVARYFNREETKAERVKQSILDAELLLKELSQPAGK